MEGILKQYFLIAYWKRLEDSIIYLIATFASLAILLLMATVLQQHLNAFQNVILAKAEVAQLVKETEHQHHNANVLEINSIILKIYSVKVIF